MELHRTTETDDTAAELAERARQATLSLYLRAAGLHGSAGIGSTAEVAQVLASMKALVDNVVRSLPELSAWLEQQLFAGTLPTGPGEATFECITRSMRDASAALARARNVGAQLGRDLETAQVASRNLVSP
ncbi:MAG TPA: hypothetical protein VFV67_12670 [Actinophytocola sp.]|uniref:hypothetical protein n=1 Tax=Actinophytocola sp. TaxID=1872138 RepID=UPI002DBEF9C0|nr:hypothetical protein [Actinophytocola sp.]HEU5471500.1 hypothetical protein [Actinophytocola sp.]